MKVQRPKPRAHLLISQAERAKPRVVAQERANEIQENNGWREPELLI